MDNSVINGFITRISSFSANLDYGYWTALLIAHRFEKERAVLCWSIPDERFVVRIGLDYWDGTGCITHKYAPPIFPPVEWSYYQTASPADANRIKQDIFGG